MNSFGTFSFKDLVIEDTARCLAASPCIFCRQQLILQTGKSMVLSPPFPRVPGGKKGVPDSTRDKDGYLDAPKAFKQTLVF